MRQFNLIALGLAFTLVGCQLPLNLPQAVSPAGQGATGAAPGLTPADAQAPRMGTLRFAVRWPERDLPGFSAQVIPVSTEKIVFELWDAEDKKLTTEELRRAASQDIATTALHLPEGTGYRATVTAYDAQNVAIARGFGTNLSVTWGQTTPVPIILDSLFAPHITSLGHGHGTPGQSLTISGENLVRGLGNPVVIFPSGVQVTGTPLGNQIQATIPANAGSGQLMVKVDGVTSTSNAPFQEVASLELSAVGVALGDIRDGDGAIASWLGDDFRIIVHAKDTADKDILNPTSHPELKWIFPADGIGMIDADGTYFAQKLGRSTIGVTLGTISGSREVVVAPPADGIIRVAETTKGITDLNLIRVGDRYLAAWFVPAESKIYWQMRDADGKPDGIVHSESCAWDGFERAFRMSAAPDANGKIHEILFAYRVTLPASDNPAATRNGVVFRTLDPLTGAYKGSRYNINGTRLEADRLLDVGSSQAGHLIGTLRFDGSKYKHRLIKVTFDVNGALTSSPALSYDNTEFVPYSYRDDNLSITGSGEHFVVSRHTGSGGGSGPTAMSLVTLDANLDSVRTLSHLHEQNRVAAVATNGETTVVASMEVSAGGTILKLYPYTLVNGEYKAVGLGQTIAELNIAGSDPLNWPLHLEWSPGATAAEGRFILTYGRKFGTVVNNQLVYYSQAMVQAIKPDGMLDGPAYPLAKDSQMPTLAPSAEGGMALWLDPARSLVMRRIRYRNLP